MEVAVSIQGLECFGLEHLTCLSIIYVKTTLDIVLTENFEATRRGVACLAFFFSFGYIR